MKALQLWSTFGNLCSLRFIGGVAGAELIQPSPTPGAVYRKGGVASCELEFPQPELEGGRVDWICPPCGPSSPPTLSQARQTPPHNLPPLPSPHFLPVDSTRAGGAGLGWETGVTPPLQAGSLGSCSQNQFFLNRPPLHSCHPTSERLSVALDTEFLTCAPCCISG